MRCTATNARGSCWRHLWRAALVAAGGSLALACVDPESDYHDYLARTAGERAAAAASNLDAAPIDATPPDAGFSTTYVMACESPDLGASVDRAVLFVAKVEYSPVAGGGALRFAEAPLRVGATDVTQTVGPWSAPPPVPVGTSGIATVDFGATTLPGAADPLGEDIVFRDSKLEVVLSSTGTDGGTRICAGQGGTAIAPLMKTLDPASNPCAFQPAGPPFPAFTQGEFHCL